MFLSPYSIPSGSVLSELVCAMISMSWCSMRFYFSSLEKASLLRAICCSDVPKAGHVILCTVVVEVHYSLKSGWSRPPRELCVAGSPLLDPGPVGLGLLRV